MYYLKTPVENEIIIQKSRFIGIITPMTSSDDFQDVLKGIKKKYPKATHYCSAYILQNTQGSNDDGEPSGTAGVPMLEVLNKHELKNIYAVVVRYYGGIKLGAGGLIRAYRKAISETLKKAEILKSVQTQNFEVTFTYDKIHLIDSLFENHITEKNFLADVNYRLSFIDDTNLFDTHQYLFKEIKNHGTKDVLIPWKKINHIE